MLWPLISLTLLKSTGIAGAESLKAFPEQIGPGEAARLGEDTFAASRFIWIGIKTRVVWSPLPKGRGGEPSTFQS